MLAQGLGGALEFVLPLACFRHECDSLSLSVLEFATAYLSLTEEQTNKQNKIGIWD